VGEATGPGRPGTRSLQSHATIIRDQRALWLGAGNTMARVAGKPGEGGGRMRTLNHKGPRCAAPFSPTHGVPLTIAALDHESRHGLPKF